MSDTVIRVENLYKEYRLGTVNHGTLRHDLASWWAKTRGKEDPNSLITAVKRASTPASATPSPNLEKGSGDEAELKSHFLAVNDVSFEVKQGDVLGIIGRNGAGKSTLLKILSRITSPSSGSIKIKGKMSSLLEVGTGFHPELTGRENVYMNGAILGMRRHEISRKIDEIVAFAGLEKFIDTPVKRYSSGMYVRLAFAVAANLDSDILILDEVLAVGDAQFQKKCLGKMDDVAKKQGRTVLFVSHNMGAIGQLCSKALLLNDGNILIDGSTRDAVSEYLKGSLNEKVSIDKLRSPGKGELIKIESVSTDGIKNIFDFSDKLKFSFEISSKIEKRGLRLAASIFRMDDVCIGTLFSTQEFAVSPVELTRLDLEINDLFLSPGDYKIGFSVGEGDDINGRFDYDIVIGYPFRISIQTKGSMFSNWNDRWGNVVIVNSLVRFRK